MNKDLEGRVKFAARQLFYGYKYACRGDSEEMITRGARALEALVGKSIPWDPQEVLNMTIEEYTDGWITD